MKCYDRIDVSEEIDLMRQENQKSVILFATGIF